MFYPKELSNKSVSQLLKDMAAVLVIKKDDPFRIRAYQNASVGVRHLGSSIRLFWEQGKLQEIPGVGANIAQHLDELFKTGKVKHFDFEARAFPDGFFELLKLYQVGPRTAWKLSKKFKLNNAKTAIKKLKKIASNQGIRTLPGFGIETEKDILKSINRFLKKSKKRISLFEAMEAAKLITDYMLQNNKCLNIQALGSLRRQVETVGDIDFAATSLDPLGCVNYFVKFPQTKKVIVKGETTARILIEDDIQVDLKVVGKDFFGSLMQHFTGSKQHNILLREYALQRGYSLSEYGIRKLKSKNKKIKISVQNSKLIKFKKEQGFYDYLGMQWIPPELREGRDEIEKAKKGKLPKLLKITDIKGDLHVHSDINIMPSHDLGQSSLKELYKKAKELNYQYLGISDHNPRISNLAEKKALDLLKKRKEQIEIFNYSSEKSVNKRGQKVFFLNSLEVDIKPDGSLALPKNAYELFDFIIVSVHSSFKMPKTKMTKRILKALENPKVKIIGHPTCRMIGRREGIELNWEKIFEKCLEKDIYLEINSFPLRMDLPDYLVKQAIEKGLKLAINSDSHSVRQMDLMPFGLAMARRGWAQKKDIVNTLPVEKLKSMVIK